MDEVGLGSFMFGNINEHGNLEDDILDEEVKNALSKVSKAGSIGLSTNISIPIDGPILKSAEIEEKDSRYFALDAKIYINPKNKGKKRYKEVINPFHNHDRGLVYFTDFFSSVPVSLRNRYKFKKVRARTKRVGRSLAIREDQSSAFRKASADGKERKYQNFLEKILANQGPSASFASKLSRRLEDIQQTANENSKHPFHSLQSFFVTSDVKEMGEGEFHPIQIEQWEDNIYFDVDGKVETRIKRMLFADVPVTLQQSFSGKDSRYGSQHSSRLTSPLISSSRLTSPSQYQFRSNLSSPFLNSRPTSPNQSAFLTAPKSPAGRISNHFLISDDWTEKIIFDDTNIPITTSDIAIQLNMNDPNILLHHLDVASIGEKLLKTERLIQKRLKKIRNGNLEGKSFLNIKYERPINDRFNFSNDKFYEIKKDGISKKKNANRGISSSKVSLQHSIPALKLQMPFYKTSLSKSELRSWHRPKLNTAKLMNAKIQFSATQPLDQNTQILNNPKKLSLKFNANEYCLVEYCEESPIVLANIGMASRILNVYRKTSDVEPEPEHNYEHGELKMLEPNDYSPFGIFGDVKPGNFVPMIQNNLFKSPLVPHSVQPTDFLLIKNNERGTTKSSYYLKLLPKNILTAGQVLPSLQIFGPNSRKHNNFCRNRIQNFAYRLFMKDKKKHANESNYQPRFRISKILNSFPHFSEGSLRKWLKEYAESVRSGRDSGFWKMKSDAPKLSEDDLRSLVTPESLCLYESMAVGQQKLNDAGLTDNGISNAKSEQIIYSPWTLTQNYLSACLGKCTLEIGGMGDPTGVGAGFSLLKAVNRVPNLNLKPSQYILAREVPESKTATEQAFFKRELLKTWNLQMESLSITDPQALESKFKKDAKQIPKKPSPSPKTKTLTIKRAHKDSVTGIITVVEETLTDDRLIASYLTQRKIWERKRKRRMIAAAASAARTKKQRLPTHVVKSPSDSSTSIKCGSCGQIGHIKTNRICPNFMVSSNVDAAKRMKSSSMDHPGTPIAQIKLKLSAPLFSGSSLNEKILYFVESVVNDPLSIPFHDPVDKELYPHYYHIVSDPLDLNTVRRRALDRQYENIEEFEKDIKLIKDNCVLFNLEDHPFTIYINGVYQNMLEFFNLK